MRLIEVNNCKHCGARLLMEKATACASCGRSQRGLPPMGALSLVILAGILVAFALSAIMTDSRSARTVGSARNADHYRHKTAIKDAVCFKSFDEGMMFITAAKRQDTEAALAIQLRNSEIPSGTKVTVVLTDSPFDVGVIDSGARVGEKCYLMPTQLQTNGSQ